jgi:NuA3 HAT complex component NTO1
MREAKIEADSAENAHEAAKAARAHAKKYTQGPPLVPAMIVNRILQYISKARPRKARDCVERICRYWSLKREARRGAPLLKRLHLEVSVR